VPRLTCPMVRALGYAAFRFDNQNGPGGFLGVLTGICLEARSVNGCFGQLQPLRSHLSEDGARFWIGRHLCQLQAMCGVADVSLPVVD
jgi:hypothetical protein